ncbi:MAG: hypothetical protein JWP25_8248 [Bradyrhizobium sp.]|nr:hypothetical protein [Bradyrhizobium sp.]
MSDHHDRVSKRDILLQLYSERKIARVELLAGRMWQQLMHEGSIQPSCSFDFSISIWASGTWQADGDLTDTQYRAMRRRGILRRALGYGVADMLDSVLLPDVGRAEILRTYNGDGRSVIERLCFSLKEVAVCLGFSTRIILADGETDPDHLAHIEMMDFELAEGLTE